MLNKKNVNESEIASLIKGERSAVETYKQVFEKYSSDADMDKLRHFSLDHKNAMQTLVKEARALGVETPDSSGAWGTWAKIVTGTAKSLTKKAALKALKEGEEHGLKQYKDALDEDGVPLNMKTTIRETLIPSQQKHISEIDLLMDRAS